MEIVCTLKAYRGFESLSLRQKRKTGQRKLSYFLRRERCSKLGRCKHRPSCTRLRLRHTLTAIAVRRIPRLPPKLKAGQQKLSYFLRRERCSKLGRCKHRPSCTRLRQRRTLTAIAVSVLKAMLKGTVLRRKHLLIYKFTGYILIMRKCV